MPVVILKIWLGSIVNMFSLVEYKGECKLIFRIVVQLSGGKDPG